MDYFFEHIEMCFENLWQVVIKSSVLYLVFSNGQSYCSQSLAKDCPRKGDSAHLIAP